MFNRSLASLLILLLGTSAFAQTTAPASNPADAHKAPRIQIDRQIGKARLRMRQDQQKHTPEQLKQAEELYQVPNKNWRTPEAQASLEKMVQQFPDVNRTGCAVLYLGQYSVGEQREKYLKDAAEKFGDCYYGNGVQVGAFARYLLALYYRENNQPDKARQLFDEILKNYADAVTHRGDSLAAIVKDEIKSPAATQPAQ